MTFHGGLDPAWLFVVLGALWFLRWYIADRRGQVSLGHRGRFANPVEVILGGLRMEVRQNTKRVVAVFGFVFGGIIVFLETIGYTISFMTYLDPISWGAAVAGAFGAVRLLGYDVPVVVALLLITVATAVMVFARRRVRGY